MMKLNGVKLPHHKNTAGNAPERIATPAQVTIPMSMHIGIPAVPVVKADVYKRQPLPAPPGCPGHGTAGRTAVDSSTQSTPPALHLSLIHI